jgi:DNA-directed RNA polymerase subunit M/transcription elongation factor TFIIS
MGLTFETIQETRPLKSAYSNASKELPEIFNEDMIVALLDSIYRRSCKEATSLNILSNWNSDVFIKIFNGVHRHNMINICKEGSYISHQIAKGRLVNGGSDKKVSKSKLAEHQIKSCRIAAQIDNFEKDPDQWEETREEVALKENESIAKLNLASNVTCHKCKKNEVFMMQIQTCSSDEPETLFYQCTNCDNKWRKHA